MQEPPWMPLSEDAGPQPDEMARLQQVIDYQELAIVEHEALLDQWTARIIYLERLLDRAYPLLRNPYTQQIDPLLATTYDTIIREVETVIQHLKEEDDPERVKLGCASCDGDGCPNCEAPMVLSE